MATPTVDVPILLTAGVTGYVKMPKKIADYFDITISPAEASPTVPTQRERAAHTRKLRSKDALNDTVIKEVAVQKAKFYDAGTRKRGGRGSGKAIKVPTELYNEPGVASSGVRYVTLRVPSNAINYAIAMWINTRFGASHKPNHFLTPSGQRYPTNVQTVADPNPGEEQANESTPAA